MMSGGEALVGVQRRVMAVVNSAQSREGRAAWNEKAAIFSGGEGSQK